MIMTVPLFANESDGGLEFISAYDAILGQLSEWDCEPFEVFVTNTNHSSMIQSIAESPGLSFWAFEHIDGNRAVMALYIPDDHPAALMAKLTWGGDA